MELVPKFASGGNSYSQFLADYLRGTPWQYVPQQEKQSTTASATSSSSDNGQLTEKDLFNMMKDMKGLPNEMKEVSDQFQGVINSGMLSSNPTLMASVFMQAVEKSNMMKMNRERYDSALKDAQKNGAMNEPAITENGDVLVQSSNGKVQAVSPQTLLESQGDFTPISVNNLLNLRAYDPSLTWEKDFFNVVENSVGFESFQKMIKSAINNLGSTTIQNELRQPIDVNTAIEGIEELTAEGIDYLTLKQSETSKSSKDQINMLVDYIMSVAPKRMKTWAILKTGIQNGKEAVGQLAFEYLGSGENKEHKTVQQVDAKQLKGSSGGNGDLNQDKLKSGYWTQVQNGQIGQTREIELMGDQTTLRVDGQYLGQTEGMDKGDLTLEQYLGQSGLGMMLRSPQAIKFGNETINSESYSQFVVDTGRGATRVMLPMDPNTGAVDFSILPDFAQAMYEIHTAEQQGIQPNVQGILSSYGLDWLYSSANGGGVDYSKLGCFIMVHGVTHDKASIMDGQTPVRIRDAGDLDYVQRMHPTDQDYQHIQNIIGDKHIDNGAWYDPGLFGTAERLYSGMIFIPITANRNSSGAADSLSRTESQAKALAMADQQSQKVSTADKQNTYLR